MRRAILAGTVLLLATACGGSSPLSDGKSADASCVLTQTHENVGGMYRITLKQDGTLIATCMSYFTLLEGGIKLDPSHTSCTDPSGNTMPLSAFDGCTFN